MNHQEFDILNGTDEFPYPISIIQTDFKNFNTNNHEIDLFLYKNYRFNNLDSIIKELNQLSQNLNQNLLDLINNDYHEFIELGKSINNGLNLINNIIEDLKNFQIDLINNYYKKFFKLDNQLFEILQNRQILNNLKTCIKLNLILHDQIIEFDNCINNINNNQLIENLNQLKILTSLYLSINNIEIFLNKFIQLSNINNDNHNKNYFNSPFHDNYINNKISSIKLEFKSFLDQLIRKELNQKKNLRNSQMIFELLNIYKLIGEEKNIMNIINNK
ncbi:conserved hypothetical protein [Candida dubliniensis CD36]|uniref:Conserved oligomeric Golgi complex subunit 2 n=1 Tax=Candida dubliniensis (strain CD36 / ATCC MYA-646 / CBS 7987 / NCPF 3949 / NRRL Y-17841) TaxID=573826 RepID=B9WL69_CANDC|nr:conserved hypothetical protein [Candida dubliniensis CD36]CAX39774.1 conserved hypothetical protein [Candida dubliniensis CD36]